jgi:NADPH:quinone reductase-like Zn-dependent oxidoreductase
MNAAVIEAWDAPPRYRAFAEPLAEEGEMLVEVTAAGLHPIVKALANGTHYASTGQLPFIAGIDGVGRLADGRLVYFGMGRRPFGTFAERSVARRAMCLDLPQGTDAATAAGMMNPGMSSWVALRARARLAAGESVLILGATGVAGQLAVQVAKRLGARRIMAAGRNPAALEKLRDLGADAVLSLDQEHAALVSAIRREFVEGGVDVVLDYLWGHPAEAVLEALSQKGPRPAVSRVRLVQVGESAGSTISVQAATLRSSGLEILGSGFGSASLEQIMQMLGDFLREAARQRFQINIRPAPLRDVASLWNRAEAGARLVFHP